MRPKSCLARTSPAAVNTLCRLSLTLVCAAIFCASAHGSTVYIDGDDGNGNAPAVFNSIDVGSFEFGDGDADFHRQSWRGVRMANLEVDGGQLTKRNGGGFGTNANMEGDNYIRLETDRVTALPDVPDSFVVGDLPGQYNVIQFDLRYDAFPPEDPNNPG